MRPGCEIHFLDVGHGCSSLIYYKNGDRDEAVIIDCGQGKLLKQVIEGLNVPHIAAMIVTHSHRDHLGGLGPILRDVEWGGMYGKIDAVYLVPDIHTHKRKGKSSMLHGIIMSLRDRENAGLLRTYFLDRRNPIVSAAIGEHRLELRALAPSATENQIATDTNSTSGIIELTYAGHRVLFSGDSSLVAWRRILEERGGTPIECEAAVVPHHGGRMGSGTHAGYAKVFFNQIVKAKHAILSFSASNQYGHPRLDVIRAARDSKATVLCTQIHPRRNRPPYKGDGVVPPTRFSRSGMHSGKPELSRSKKTPGRRKHFACAGSITLSLAPNEARWGASEDFDAICGFRTLNELRNVIQKSAKCKKCACIV
jgi:beta-lactamase superfamily II metal-dependent hydrolase